MVHIRFRNCRYNESVINSTPQKGIPHEIKKRAIYTEILAENANPKSIFELPSNSIERAEYEDACKYITERVFKHG